MANRFPREFYVPKSYSAKISPKGAPAVVYFYEKAGVAYAIGFYGKAEKPSFHHRYRSEAERGKCVAQWIKSAVELAERKAKYAAEAAAERAKPHSLEVGQYLVSSWGYDQTNVDFYRVEKVLGPHMVEIVKVSGINTASGHAGAYSGHAIPGEQVIGEPMRKRVQPGGSIKIASYAYARVWEGKPVGWTAYA